MKSILPKLLVLVMLMFPIGCSEEDSPGPTGVTTPSLQFTAPSVIFDHQGGNRTIGLKFKNIKTWSIEGSLPSWLTVSYPGNTADTLVTLSLTALHSSETTSRTATITISALGGRSGTVIATAQLKVRQTPPPEIANIATYPQKHLFLAQNNGDVHKTGTTNITYKICSSPAMNPIRSSGSTYTFSNQGTCISFDINVESIDGMGLPPTGTYTVGDNNTRSVACTFDYGYYYNSGWYSWNGGTYFETVNSLGTVTSTQYVVDGTIKLERSGNSYSIAAHLFDDNDNEFICTYTGLLVVFDGYGTVERDLTVVSNKLVPGTTTRVKYSVILPRGYTSTRKYPVLYLLHGYGGSNNSWLDDGNAKLLTSNAIDAGTVSDFVVIMPDGYNAFYCNGFQNGYQYMTFFFEEFVPYVETAYNIDPNKRAIAGLSMGGFGTLYFALLHPEMFDLGYAMSPAIGVMGGINLSAMATSAGSGGTTLPRVVVACGTSDYVVYNALTFSNFDAALESAGFSHRLVLDANYSHTWDYWQLCYPRVMEELGKLW